MLGWLQFTKGHNSLKTVDGVMVLNLYTKSDDALSLYHVSRTIQVICILKFSKGYNSVKSVCEVKVLVLYTLSHNALYLYQDLP